MRRSVSDVTVDNDQRGSVFGVLEGAEGASQHLKIIRIANTCDIPPICNKTRGDVFGKRERCVAFDRDVVVVVNPAEIGEPPVAGERGCLTGDSFHHAPISAQSIHVEIKEIFESGSVVTSRQPLPGSGDAYAGSNALSERTSCGLHARCPPVLRMSWAAA